MSANIPAVHFELAIARSEFLDAHNEADYALRLRLAALDGASRPLLGENIQALQKIPANPKYAKQEKVRADALLNELKSLQHVRCDLVHSPMATLNIDGKAHAFFPNVQKQHCHGRTGLLLTLEELKSLTLKLKAIAKGLSPRTSPAVAGVPNERERDA